MNPETRQQLREHLAHVIQGPGENESAYLASIRELDRLATSPDLPLELVHFLKNRSYTKAMNFVDNHSGMR